MIKQRESKLRTTESYARGSSSSGEKDSSKERQVPLIFFDYVLCMNSMKYFKQEHQLN